MKKITAVLWRRFEEVVSLAIKSILEDAHIDEIQEKLTEPTHDGGYDGSFLIPYITDSEHSQNKGYYKILFEAKLRSCLDKDLPLHDFSKSLIIAINMNSDALIVATNLRLSDGTKEHLRDFSHKTGLKTYYLSPSYIDAWMKNNYSPENSSSDKKLRNLLRKAADFSDLDHPLELLQKSTLKSANRLPQLLGKKKNEILKEAVKFLKKSSGIVLIKGNAGAGKTFFCQHLIAKLEALNYSIYTIDLKNYQTPRVLFLKLLETLWHTPFEILLSLDKTNLERIVDELDTDIVDDNVKEAVLSAFSKDLEHYMQNADVHNYYMIKYLLSIYSIRAKHCNIILYFSNINSLSTQMVDFMLHFLNNYALHGRTIIELRTSTYIDTHMESEKWERYVKQFCSLETILYQKTINEFALPDAYKYIRITLDDIQPDIVLMDAILNVTGKNPLFLGSLVEYLNVTGLLKNLPREVVLQRINHLIIDDKRQIISMLINALSEKEPFFATFFEIIRIFQMPVKESYVANILTDYQIYYIDFLIEVNLVLRYEGILSVVHPLQYECILKNHSLMDFSKRMLAMKILNTIDDTMFSAEQYAMIQIRCYRILQKNNEIIEIAYPLAIGLLESGQYTVCYEYAREAFEKIEVIDSKYKMLIHLKILLLMVEICIYQEEESVCEIDDYMEKLDYAVLTYSNKHEKENEFISFKAQYFMTKNRYEHFKGLFENAFDTLTEALEFVEHYKNVLGNQVIGNVQLEYAIALKEKEDLNQSINYLNKCLEDQPTNVELLFTFHTQMYELLLFDQAEQALEHIETNRSLCTQLSIATTIHNEVHWLNTQFYLRNYDICFSQATSIFEETEQMGLKNEEGRLMNLIGNLYFQKKDFQNAKIHYMYGIDLFQEKGYITNIWPLLINMSTLLSELKDENALYYIDLSIDILSNSYRERILKPYSLPGYYAKLQVAVVILYYNIRILESVVPIEQIETMLKKLSQSLLTEEKRNWLFQLSSKEIIAILEDTPHYHSSFLLLGV